MCSGDAVRIMHKQEQAYLCFGEAGNGDDKKNRLHLFSRDREPIAMTCSNALWHFVQLDGARPPARPPARTPARPHGGLLSRE